jgi:peptidoglycan/LPS O-acetylase OafA/YrhL
MVYSPAHLVWAGSEAVLVFFVLSGFVLTLPALRRTQDWIAYYPSRLVRLYVPVIASIALALVFFFLVPRQDQPHQAFWINRHAEPFSLHGLLGDVTLFAPTLVNSPLWSLTWEVLFSLLLPLFVSIAAVTRRWWWATALLAVLLSALGEYEHQKWLMYLPMFLLGSALAAGWERLPAVPNPLGWVLLVVALLGIVVKWWLPVTEWWSPVLPAVVLASAGTIVVLAGKWLPAERLLLGRLPRELGRLSFSLYLVHEPITVSVANLLPNALPSWLVIVAIPIGVAVAYVFSRLVELPAHRLAKRIAKSLSERPPVLQSA